MSLLSVTVMHMFLLCVTVKYMSLLCRYMLESVRSMSQHLEGVDAEVSVGSGARGSKRSREDKRQVSSSVSQKGLCRLVLVYFRRGCAC